MQFPSLSYTEVVWGDQTGALALSFGGPVFSAVDMDGASKLERTNTLASKALVLISKFRSPPYII